MDLLADDYVRTTIENKEDLFKALNTPELDAEDKQLAVILWALKGFMEETVLVNLIDMFSMPILFYNALGLLSATNQISMEDVKTIFENVKNSQTQVIYMHRTSNENLN